VRRAPKKPVKEGAVVITPLIRPLAADGERVGDLEERPFVFRHQFGSEQVPTLFEEPSQGGDRRATLLHAGVGERKSAMA